MRRLVRALVGSGRSGDRPGVVTVLFWGGIGLSWLARLTQNLAELVVVASVHALLTGLLVVVWCLVGWSPGSQRRWTVALAVLGTAFAATEGSGSAAYVVFVALANIVLVLGSKAAIGSVAGLGVVLGLSVRFYFDRSWRSALAQLVGIVFVTGVVIGVAHLIVTERRGRTIAAQLLRDLEASHHELARSHEELTTAHAELERRSTVIRDLAVADERARLAREVHDAVGHHLTVAKLSLTNALRYRELDPDSAWQEVSEARDAASTALDETRRAVRAMGPAPLAEASIRTALGGLASSYDGSGLKVSVDSTGPEQSLPPLVAATMYRVAEEGLTNVVRHAVGATRARLEVAYQPQEVTLTVSDDGRPAPPLRPGFGLAGVRSRLAEVGGRLELDQLPAGGVRLTARVPVPVTA